MNLNIIKFSYYLTAFFEVSCVAFTTNAVNDEGQFDYTIYPSQRLGCYLYSTDYRKQFSGTAYEDQKSEMQTSTCLDKCANSEYTFAGLFNGNTCFCSNNMWNGEGTNVTDCNKPCTGNQDDNCGGTTAVALYQSCKRGHYGRSCEMICYCWEFEPCDISTGACLSADRRCRDGFVGERCDQEVASMNGAPYSAYKWMFSNFKSLMGRNYEDIPKVCPQMKYGLMCSLDCFCESGCDRVTGICNKQQCLDEYKGNRCDRENQCSSKSCKNGGTCHYVDFVRTCECANGFTGQDCEFQDLCNPNPCENGGSCSSTDAILVCTCAGLFAGKYCQIDDSKVIINPTYVGCHRDANSNLKQTPDLETRLTVRTTANGMDIKTCLRACRAKMFTFAGLQNGNECFCGNEYGRMGSVANSYCNKKCDGDASSICGGHYYNSIYSVCPHGRYKFDCSEECHCLGVLTQCDLETGRCPSGRCQVGYTGPACDIPVPDPRDLYFFYYMIFLLVTTCYAIICLLVISIYACFQRTHKTVNASANNKNKKSDGSRQRLLRNDYSMTGSPPPSVGSDSDQDSAVTEESSQFSIE